MSQANNLVSFKRPDGREVSGYLARPAKLEGAPAIAAIVVIQEWWGLNDQIRGVADRLAASGYLALVPDLYRGESTVEEEEAHHLMSKLDFAEAVAQDIRGAVQYLGGYTKNIGITGFCMGGALTLLSLNAIPELTAGLVRLPSAGIPQRLGDQGAIARSLGHPGPVLRHRNRRCPGSQAA